MVVIHFFDSLSGNIVFFWVSPVVVTRIFKTLSDLSEPYYRDSDLSTYQGQFAFALLFLFIKYTL